ncbi:MAG: hypothetical protein KatS3mg119_0016 [Rhodothalassiaceae bacterium]|nr:MAG: hypothetical protein KatS3mg119_0016 [Rhodothalassiaceae bacterium]
MTQPADDDADDIPGEDILPLLRGPHGAAVAAALVGCRFYRDDPDCLWTIRHCDANAGRLSVSMPGGTSRNVALAAGCVLVSRALRRALDAAITPELRAAQDKRRAIAAYGFVRRVDERDLDDLYAAVCSARQGRVPPDHERARYIGLAEKYGQPYNVIKPLSAWIDAAPGSCLPDLLIPLIRHLRHSGRTIEALKRTEQVLARGSELTDGERRVLLIQRAALLMDRFEQTGDRELLDEARRCADRSWAIEPGDHCRAIYRRLDSLKR